MEKSWRELEEREGAVASKEKALKRVSEWDSGGGGKFPPEKGTNFQFGATLGGRTSPILPGSWCGIR